MDDRFDPALIFEHPAAANSEALGGLNARVVLDYSERRGHFDAWLTRRVLRDGLVFMHSANWTTEHRLDAFPAGMILGASTRQKSELAVVSIRGMLVRVGIYADSCYVDVFSRRHSPGDVEAVIAQLKGWLTPKEPGAQRIVRIGFRFLGRDGSRYIARDVEAPAWEEIAANYPQVVRDSVERLVSFRPAGSGNLLLFQGPPGTGKTYVLRALAREWRSWCHFEYITDADRLLRDADYLMRVVLEGEDDIDALDDDEDAQERWRLLVIEDGGGLISRSARGAEAQGLSRLLNLGEGLIGQGARVLVAISTNDDLSEIDAAVSRPGRTSAAVSFTAFSIEESMVWLAAHGVESTTVGRPLTLAELYAMTSGGMEIGLPPSAPRPIGLRR